MYVPFAFMTQISKVFSPTAHFSCARILSSLSGIVPAAFTIYSLWTRFCCHVVTVLAGSTSAGKTHQPIVFTFS